MQTLRRLGRFVARFPMSTALVFVTIAAFLVQAWLGSTTDPALQLRMGALRADRVVEHGELYRLVTPMFIHHGPIHLVLNLIALGQLAILVEMLWGGRRLLLFYVVSGIVASLATAALTSPGYDSSVGSVGSSGAIMGLAGVLLGATWVAREPARTWLRGLVGSRLLTFVVLVFVVGIGFSLVLPIVDNWAHLGGFATGMLLAAAHPDPTEQQGGVMPTIGSSLAGGTVIAALLTSVVHGGRALETFDIDSARMLAARLSNEDLSSNGTIAPAYTGEMLVSMWNRFERAGAVEEGREVFVRHLDRVSHPRTAAYVAVALSEETDPLVVHAAFERWAALAPDDASALNALAWDLVTTDDVDLRDPARAEPLSRKSLSVLGEPEGRAEQQAQAAYLDTLAEVLYQLGRFDEALNVQRRSVDMARSAEVDADTLGELESRLQKIEAAASG